MKVLFLYITCFICCSLTAQHTSILSMRKANDMIYDSLTEKIYTSLSSEDPDNPNSIGIINPADNILISAIPTEEEPSIMAISDNSQYIYFGTKNSSKIKRLDIASLTIDQEFELGADDENYEYTALDIKVVPNNPLTIVVVRKLLNNTTTDTDGGLGVYEDGIMKPDDLDSALNYTSNQIYFKNPTTIIGYLGTNISNYTLNSNGIYLSNKFEDVINPHPVTIPRFEYHNNKAYFSNGNVLDVTSTPTYIGQLNSETNNAVTFDTSNNLVCCGFRSSELFYYENGIWNVSLKRFNPETYELYDEYKVTAYGEVHKIITCGDGCLALHTSNKDNNNENFLIINNLPLSSEKVNFNNRKLCIYPTISSNIINITTNDGIIIQSLSAYDIEGKIVLNTFENDKIDISNLCSGLYILKLTDNNYNTYIEKFIKN
ncbi:hypothetical protein D3C87_289500 [compost metagenome]